MPFERRIGYHFAKLHRLMLWICKEDIGKLGIQQSQIPFLITLLREAKPVTQDMLSTDLVIDKAATARALDRLEKKGFISRKINPDNRRQKLVSATPKAHGIAARIHEIFETTNDTFTKGFTKEELNTAITLLNRMIDNALEVKMDTK